MMLGLGFLNHIFKYSDASVPSVKEVFTKYCDKRPYLKKFKNSLISIEYVLKDDLSHNPNNESNESLVKYELIYNNIVVKRNYYSKSEQRRYKKFNSELKRETKTIIVPLFERDKNLDHCFIRTI